jgi:hypothetical protein
MSRDCPLCDESGGEDVNQVRHGERSKRPEQADLGGESACYVHLLCERCGVVLDGSPHAAECGVETRE